MTRDEQVQHFRIALALQKIGVTDEIADRIIETYELLLKKGGKFSVHDAVDIQLRIDRKYTEKSVHVKET